MPDQRQSRILCAVVNEYIKTAKPVSSEAIANKYSFDISPATVRNVFADLTSEGYLNQPHISAGRAPTNRGYRHYVDLIVKRGGIEIDNELERFEETSEELAETVARLSGLLAAAWSESGDTAIRGLKYILAEPEFQPQEASLRIASTMDLLPWMLEQMFAFDSAAGIYIGSECHFWDHDDASIVFRKVRFPNLERGVTCIVGPTRMRYLRSWKLLVE